MDRWNNFFCGDFVLPGQAKVDLRAPNLQSDGHAYPCAQHALPLPVDLSFQVGSHGDGTPPFLCCVLCLDKQLCHYILQEGQLYSKLGHVSSSATAKKFHRDFLLHFDDTILHQPSRRRCFLFVISRILPQPQLIELRPFRPGALADAGPHQRVHRH